jgi:hypothetical protein
MTAHSHLLKELLMIHLCTFHRSGDLRFSLEARGDSTQPHDVSNSLNPNGGLHCVPRRAFDLYNTCTIH